MNRLIKCSKFQLINMLKSTFIFLCIYFAAALALVLFIGFSIDMSGSNSSSSSSSGFYIGAAIFAFVYMIADYKATFNYLLMFGNTRKNIFLSSIITSVAMSILLAAVSILSLLVEDALSKAFRLGSTVSLLDLMYGGSNMASEFLWFTVFFTLICSFSMLYGALSYKFGKVFTIIFWVGFGLSWIIIPVLSGIDGASTFFNALGAYFCTGTPAGILLAPVNFIVTTVIFNAIAYITSSRQSQVA